MPTQGLRRKLAAILSADVEGYSLLMRDDEEATILTLATYRTAMTHLIQKYSGRVVDAPGDNLVDLLLQGWSTVISPDGPQGPQGVLKRGVLHIALQSGVPILPVRFIAPRTFALPSWDKKFLPLPFSIITVVLGEPIIVSESNFEEAAKLIADRMTNH